MAYVTDEANQTTFPCSTRTITQEYITANIDSPAGYRQLKTGDARNGSYRDNNNLVYNINLPGVVVGSQQQLKFTVRQVQ